ncbi:unnamed protein product, partial [Effrenium voratum]
VIPDWVWPASSSPAKPERKAQAAAEKRLQTKKAAKPSLKPAPKPKAKAKAKTGTAYGRARALFREWYTGPKSAFESQWRASTECQQALRAMPQAERKKRKFEQYLLPDL